MWSDGQRGRKIINYKESERDQQTEGYIQWKQKKSKINREGEW